MKGPRPSGRVPFTARLRPEIVAAVERIAVAEDRSASRVAERLLQEALRAREAPEVKT